MMEIEETDKIIIAKPVACRPGFSTLKSFPAVPSGTVNASPPAALSENAAAVIRPRTVRFKPTCNINSVGAEALASAASQRSKEVTEPKVASNVVYKPIAKLVSKTTIALLANLGGHGIIPTRKDSDGGSPIQPSNHVKHQTEPTSDVHQDFPMQTEKDGNATPEYPEDDNKLVPNNGDRPSCDGHNWRKYGHKQVKGSEYPRSYYRCTYPNCTVKKKVEKMLDGQIAEIVYNGEHNHSNPQLAYVAALNEVKNPSFTNQQANIDKGSEGGKENENNSKSSGQSALFITIPPINDPFRATNSSSSLSMGGECEEASESLEAERDNFKSKRTKYEKQLLKESDTMGGASSEPRIVLQNNTDSEIIGDGFRWRKYGQKVVKGKTYPRSYYRCTSPKCIVRKYVERMSEDPCNVITTYEGRHNHDMPVKTTNAEMSKTRTNNKS
uniref:WRKY family protein 3 n=1 Tax=Cistanche tubulosa TaxID=161397 RepID=A0A6B9EV97_9LAMI|nr:WRKY family protein 3 [Cistanche tubulosa]